MTQRPSGERVVFSIGALMLLIPVVLVLGAVFVALIYVIAGWVGVALGIAVTAWLIGTYLKRSRR